MNTNEEDAMYSAMGFPAVREEAIGHNQDVPNAGEGIPRPGPLWVESGLAAPAFPLAVPMVVGGKPRSWQWEKVRNTFLAKHPTCACCGSRKNLTAHHRKPYHLFPELELQESNLIALCEGGPWNCHFLCGHAGKAWSVYTDSPEAVAVKFRILLDGVRAMARGG